MGGKSGSDEIVMLFPWKVDLLGAGVLQEPQSHNTLKQIRNTFLLNVMAERLGKERVNDW